MNTWNVFRIFTMVFVFIMLAVSLIFPSPCLGERLPQVALETTSSQKLSLTVGRSIIVKSSQPVKRVTLVASEIADALVLTPHQIYLTGKAPGITNVTVWGVDDKVSAVLDLEISPDTSRLKEMLARILPEEKNIMVAAAHNNITLSGTVSSASGLSQALTLAESFLPKDGKLVNLLEVAGVHQVMLEVRVSEISRSLLKRLGFNFAYITAGNNFGVSLLNQLSSLPADAPGISSAINAIFRFTSSGTTWTVLIDALKEEGLLKVLAEPTLITLSGKTANFLAGGEFPIPVPQSVAAGGTTITIEYKPFGVGLSFTPTVLSNKKINMVVAPEVSDLDFSNALTTSGYVVPSITTRRVSTVIELADGQSFAIAGLLKDDVREIVSKFPLLGDIPVLGALFRSSTFRKNETELIVIVTPHLVKPVDMAKQTLPTDAYVEPDDFEFYLLGRLEGKGKPHPVKGSGLEGQFGHIVPK